ncbi:hypothetical protein ACFXPX_04680 [Kitasatospora sp. NPDC059146]|uniref:hypothetical protein n=1 Tax=unclassified Kitasatospora TaxID=2633591 RepID=UPI003689F8A0
MQPWNRDDHQIAQAERAILTFTGGRTLILADWQITENAPNPDGRVYAELRGWAANTGGAGTAQDPCTMPVESGRAQLVLAELRGREPLRDLAVHVGVGYPGKPFPNTWDHPGALATVSWMARRVDENGRQVPETEIGSTRWTDPGTGREFDLEAAFLLDGEPTGSITWRYDDRWQGGVPVLHPFWGDDRTPAFGDRLLITDRRLVPATGTPSGSSAAH